MMVLKKTAFPFSLQFFSAFFKIYLQFYDPLTFLYEASWEPVLLCLAQGYVGSKHECTGTRTESQALIRMHYRNEMLQSSITFVRVRRCRIGPESLKFIGQSVL